MSDKYFGVLKTKKYYPKITSFGKTGLNAYQLAVANGFEGTIEEWLASLHGADGNPTTLIDDAQASAIKTWSSNKINDELSDKANFQQEDWIPPTIINGWRESTYYPVGYMKDSLGFVHCKGIVTDGTVLTEIFILPENYRPIQNLTFPISANGAFGRIIIESNGNVKFQNGIPSNVAISAISFRAER